VAGLGIGVAGRDDRLADEDGGLGILAGQAGDGSFLDGLVSGASFLI
jgi:hypothetical protein